MIVGKQILERGLVTGGTEANLKNSTFDLTVGEIVPIGKKAIRARRKDPLMRAVFLEPREMVWVLSKEEFNMPADVTGFATLRTTFTKQGILALNVGIIDPLFKGPISTALINFSDRPREIRLGDKFFRVAFLPHADVSDFHAKDENVDRSEYVKYLENISYADFSPSFLNIPKFDDDYYFSKFWSLVWQGITRRKVVSVPILVLIGLVFWYLLDSGMWAFIAAKLDLIGDFIKRFKIV
jgi:deoxycytidine triphosphate deaminase